jgi:hypothetical protein
MRRSFQGTPSSDDRDFIQERKTKWPLQDLRAELT